MRLGSACLATLVVLLVLGPSAVEAKPARPAPPPAGCTPTRIDKLPLAAGEVCVHDVLVTQTWNTEEQNHTTFAVADRHATLIATIGHWWPQGPPTAGMMVTLWGQVQQDR